MGTLDILNTIGSGLRVVLDGPTQVELGQPVNVGLIPDNLPNLTVPVITSGNLDVTWLTKSVRFDDALLPSVPVGGSLADVLATYLANPTKVIGGMPIPNIQMPINLTQVGVPTLPKVTPNPSDPKDLLSGVPGLLGQLAASIPIPALAPLTLTINWQVTKPDQIVIRNGQEILIRTVLAEGSDFLAPHGLSLPKIDLIFKPDFVERTNQTVLGLTELAIRADVTLSAGGVTTPTIAVPPVPVFVPQIGLPTVLALFRHANFQAQDLRAPDKDVRGFVFVMVPGNSPFQFLNELAPVILKLQTDLGSLTRFTNIATFLLGLNEFVNAANTQPLVQFRAQDTIDDLQEVKLVEGQWQNFVGTGNDGGRDANDQISSLIFVGVPNKKVRLLNDFHHLLDQGAFTVTIGADLYAMVRFFGGKGATPTSEPPSSNLTVDEPSHEEDQFNDRTSSIEFGTGQF